jgi:phosphatidate cytidylyltransferase
MPFDSKTFKTRSLSAVIFVVIMLSSLFLNPWSFITIFVIIHFGCWVEFIALLKKIDPRSFQLKAPLGLLYITLPLSLLIYMRVAHGWFTDDRLLLVVPCGIVFSIWINDTMAYIVGSVIGKTPFSPISPKKTWEGTIGGAILCVAVITLAGKLAGLYSVTDWVIISSLCAVFGTLGDLLESKIKRMAAVKDSGRLMPGHGGFLDRFDSILVATPFVALYYFMFM